MRSSSSTTALLLAVGLAVLVVAGLALRRDEGAGDRAPSTPVATADSDRALPLPPAEADRTDAPYGEDDRVRVDGLVLDRDTGAPIPGARLSAKADAGRWETTADGRGRWRLALPPRAGVRAEAEGYLPDRHSLDARWRRKEVRLRTFFLRRAPLVLRGRITDEDGAPVVGARCELQSLGVAPIAVTTGFEGRFGPVPTSWGTTYLTAVADGFVPTLTSFEITPGRSDEVSFELRLVRPVFARGVIVDREGHPIEGVRVTTKHGEPVTHTNREGRFRWPIAPNDSATLRAWKAGYDAPELEHVVAAGATTRIVLRRGVRFEGTLLGFDGRPASGLEITFSNEAAPGDHFARAGPYGRFVLSPVLAGKLEIDVHQGHVSLGRFEREVEGSAPVTGVELRLPEAEELRGQVSDALTHEGIDGAEVFGDPTCEGPPLAVTDAEGRFTVRLPVGHTAGYAFLAEGYLRGYTRYTHDGGALRPGAHLRPIGLVRLRAVDSAGRPVPGVRVGGRRVHEFHGDHEGVAIRRLPVGEKLTLVVRHPLFADAEVDATPARDGITDLGDVVLATRPGDALVVVVDEEGRPVPDAVLATNQGKFLTADARGRIRAPALTKWDSVHAPGRESKVVGEAGGKVVLRPGAPFKGRVVGPDGRGVPELLVYPSAPGVYGAHTDSHGRFEAHGAAEGTAAILSVQSDRVAGRVLQAWAIAGREVVLRHPGLATLVVPEADSEWLFDADVFLVEQEDLEAGGMLKISPRYLTLGGENRIPVPAGEIVLSYRTGRDAAPIHERLRLEPGEVRRIAPPEGRPPPIAVLPARGLEDAEVDYDVSLVTPDAPLGDFAPETGYRNVRPVWYRGPPVRLRVSDLRYATYYTAPLDLSEGATITVPLSEPGEILGFLIDPAGKPVEGAKLRLRAPFGFRHWEWDETTDEGEFYLGCDLPVGPQTIEIRLPERLPVLRRVDIGPGRLTEVEIRLD